MATAAPPRSTWASPRRRFPHDAHLTAPTGLAVVYCRPRPTTTPLYPIVQHHLETFLARAAEADPWGAGVAGWVEEDFRAYLRCGILAHGFARIRCDDCAAERLVAFSCKGRGVCPSCNARRIALPHALLSGSGRTQPGRHDPNRSGSHGRRGADGEGALRALPRPDAGVACIRCRERDSDERRPGWGGVPGARTASLIH
jgi:hypothetical protein